MKRKLLPFVSVLVLCAVLLTGCVSAINAVGIQTPDNIEYITVETRDGFVHEFNDSFEIQQICEVIEASKDTGMQSVQDHPVNVSAYGTITMYHTGIATMYYYEKGGKYYIEVPYSRIFQLKEDFETDTLPYIGLGK